MADAWRRVSSVWSSSVRKGKWQVSLGRLNNGERIAGISAILLYVFMSFDWFAVEGSNKNSHLLNLIQTRRPGQNAWEALDFISIVLLIAILAALAVAALRSMDAMRRPPVPVNAAVAILGIVSVLLILFRIVVPPDFGSEGIFEFEGTVQFPIFLALSAAAGIAFGGCLAMWEEGFSLSVLPARRHRDQGRLRPQGRVRQSGEPN